MLAELQADLEGNQRRQLQSAAVSIANMLALNEEFRVRLTERNHASEALNSIEVNDIVLDGRRADWPAHEPTSFGLENLLEIHFPYTSDSLSYDL